MEERVSEAVQETRALSAVFFRRPYSLRWLIDGQRALGKSLVANIYRGLPPFGNYRGPKAFGNYGGPKAFGNYGGPKAFGNYRGAKAFGIYQGQKAFGNYRGPKAFVATVLTVFVHMSSLGLIIRTRPAIFIDMPSAQTAVFATVSRASVNALTDMKARLAKELLARMTALAMEPHTTVGRLEETSLTLYSVHYKKEGHYRRPRALGNSPKPSVKGNYRWLIDGQRALGKSLVANIYRGLPPFGNYRGPKAFGNYGGPKAFGNYGGPKAFGNYRGAKAFGIYQGRKAFGNYRGPKAFGNYRRAFSTLSCHATLDFAFGNINLQKPIFATYNSL
ncbi:hypothetical protein LR48_Vigan479s000200 [Vigna angularis]|uniref:Uncharacterized protein n=1 Tax=Phaseolus angularis TaxID=3914 RepID=A0A0L9TBT9_PHAAN|nr:hypothetical protein LR48_Vigan479s000200 [Vigna angularis]